MGYGYVHSLMGLFLALIYPQEPALVDKYAELIITSHAENCLWRARGCDGR